MKGLVLIGLVLLGLLGVVRPDDGDVVGEIVVGKSTVEDVDNLDEIFIRNWSKSAQASTESPTEEQQKDVGDVKVHDMRNQGDQVVEYSTATPTIQVDEETGAPQENVSLDPTSYLENNPTAPPIIYTAHPVTESPFQAPTISNTISATLQSALNPQAVQPQPEPTEPPKVCTPLQVLYQSIQSDLAKILREIEKFQVEAKVHVDESDRIQQQEGAANLYQLWHLTEQLRALSANQ